MSKLTEADRKAIRSFCRDPKWNMARTPEEQARRNLGLLRAELYGCCGDQARNLNRYEVVSYNEQGEEFHRATYASCRLTFRDCQLARVQSLVDAYAIVNGRKRCQKEL